MTCSRELIESYLDQELDAVQQANLEQHLAGCADCSEAYSRLLRQKGAIKAAAAYYDAPPGFDQSIRSALRRMEIREATPLREARPAAAKRPWPRMAIAASLLLAISAFWNVVQWRSRSTQDLVDAVVISHIRSLIGDHLMDVVSTDQHTVKPWFTGKLDFSPDVKDLAAQGFPLAGGRVDYLAGRRVAVLIYHRRQHVINLFIWPDSSSASAKAPISRNGYNVLSWTAGSMNHWAISDVSARDLEAFRTLLSN